MKHQDARYEIPLNEGRKQSKKELHIINNENGRTEKEFKEEQGQGTGGGTRQGGGQGGREL